ncbi:MAG: P-loop NTPase fold protein [Verrucomicrobiota bacterium]
MAAPEEPQLPSREELKSLSSEDVVAYAARCAIRVFPFVGYEGHLNFWGKDASWNLEVVWAANLATALNDSFKARYIALLAMDANRESFSKGVNSGSINASVNAVTMAFMSEEYDFARFAYDVSSSALHALKVHRGPDFVAAAYHDFKELLYRDSFSEKIFETYLIANIEFLINDWLTADMRKAFESVGQSDLLRMWEGFFYGEPDMERCRAWLEDWYVRNQDAETEAPAAEENDEGERTKSSKKKPTEKKEADLKVEQAAFEQRAMEDWESEGGAIPVEHAVEEAEAEEAEVDSKDLTEDEAEQDKGDLPPMPAQGSATTSADVPAQVDQLNRDHLVKGLARMLSFEEQGTPITLGLFGDWGAGKSSVMQLLQKELSSEETKGRYGKFEFLFSWFNAWEYEHTRNIRAGLAQEVVNGLLSNGSYAPDEPSQTRPVDGRERFRIQRKFILQERRREWYHFLVKSTLSLIPVAAGAFGIAEGEPVVATGGLGLGIFFGIQLFKQFRILWDHPVATELGTFFKLPSYRKELGQVPVIKKQLEGLASIRLGPSVDQEMIEEAIAWHQRESWDLGDWRLRPSGDKPIPARRLIVFVDDLDRCLTKTIADVFDAVRLIAHIPGVIVVFGIDERIAFKAMGQAYADYADEAIGRSQEEVARDYLGKIIQLPIRLERPDKDGLATFIDKKLFPEEDRDPGSKQAVDAEGPDPKDEEPEVDMDELEPEADDKIDENEMEEEPASEAKISAEDATQKSRGRLFGLFNLRRQYLPPKQPNWRDRNQAKQKTEEEKKHEEELAKLKITDAEVQAFKDLTALLDLRNPRQLMRLRNTYRLLKSLYPKKVSQESEEMQDDEKRYPEAENNLMMMLFWLEYCLQNDSAKIAAWSTWSGPESKEADSIKGLFKTELLDQIAFTESKWMFKEPMLQNLKEFTETCILPYPNKESVSER